MGDSWFQHPFLNDISDGISKVYPVYCVPSQGSVDSQKAQLPDAKTLAGIMTREQPSFFMISTGAGELFGQKFPAFIASQPDNSGIEGEHPERFLTPSFLQQLDNLAETFQSLFLQLKMQYPHLVVLVHGYDYFPGLAENDSVGTSLVEKGIRSGDRQAIVRYIVDAFNLKLQEISKPFGDGVIYIDLRNTLLHDSGSWYDAAHPNDDGF